jgi:hypothetical protein
MDAIVSAAGTALVTAMTTDAWGSVREAVLKFWRRVHPEVADAVGTELDSTRAQLIASRCEADADTEQALIGRWRLELQRALDRDREEVAGQLKHLLDRVLTPALTATDQAAVRSIVQRANASGSAQIIQAGRDVRVDRS